MSSKFHITLPPQTPYSMKTGSRRTPLTPSTITPPSVSAHTPSATMKQDGHSPTTAEAMLARVAHQQPMTRRATYPASPMSSSSGEQQVMSADQWQRMQEETARYWASQPKQDGYISFPDFEKYCYQNGSQDGRQSRVAG